MFKRQTYYVCDYSIVLTFGTTEFECHVEWMEKVGPLFIILH